MLVLHHLFCLLLVSYRSEHMLATYDFDTASLSWVRPKGQNSIRGVREMEEPRAEAPEVRDKGRLSAADETGTGEWIGQILIAPDGCDLFGRSEVLITTFFRFLTTRNLEMKVSWAYT
jgi:hypothetical protein